MRQGDGLHLRDGDDVGRDDDDGRDVKAADVHVSAFRLDKVSALEEWTAEVVVCADRLASSLPLISCTPFPATPHATPTLARHRVMLDDKTCCCCLMMPGSKKEDIACMMMASVPPFLSSFLAT